MVDAARHKILSPRDPDKIAEELKLFEQEVRERVIKTYHAKSAKGQKIISQKGEEIVAGLVSQYKKKEYIDDSQEFKEKSLQTLDRLADRSEQDQNILRQEKEVKESHAKPGEIDLATLMREMETRMGISPTSWGAAHDEYGADFFRYRNYTLDDVLDEIRTRRESVLHTQPEYGKKFSPKGSFLRSYSYRQLLHEARQLVREEKIDLTKNLNHLIEHGVEMPPAKKDDKAMKALGKASVAAALGGLGGLKNVFDAVGKGLWSKSDPNYNRHLRAFYRQRNGLFSSLLWGLNPDGSKNGVAVKKMLDLLNKNNADLENEGLIDSETFKQISDLIQQELNSADPENPGLIKEHADKMAEFNQRINALNDQVVSAAKAESGDLDAMQKWRILQAVLLVTPFFGVSVLGPVMSVFGNVLMNSQGVIHGITSLMSFEYTGPFGWILEQMHIPQLLEMFFNLPVVSAPFDLLDATVGSNIVQTILGGAFLPLAASPTAALLLAGGFSIFRADAEIEHKKKYGKAFEDYSQQLKDDMAAIAKEAKDLGEDWDPNKMVNGQFEALRNFRLRCDKNELALEIANKQADPVDFLKKLMGDDLFEQLEKNGIKIVDDNGKISAKALMGFLQKIPQNNFYDKAIIFDSLLRQKDGDKKTVDELMAQVNSLVNAPNGKAIIDGWTKEQKDQFVLEKAQDIFLQIIDLKERKAMSDIFDKFENAKDGNEKTSAIGEMEKFVKNHQVKFFKENLQGADDMDRLNKLLLTPPTKAPKYPTEAPKYPKGRLLDRTVRAPEISVFT